MIIDNVFNTADNIMSGVPQLTEPKLNYFGKVGEGKDQVDLYEWNPGKGDEKLSPVIQATPADGWNFVGFLVEKENQLEQPNRFLNNISKKDKVFSAIDKFDNTSIDWNKEIVKYTAIFNKNIYNIIVKPTFWKYNQDNSTFELQNEVKELSGISISDLTRTQELTAEKFFDFDSHRNILIENTLEDYLKERSLITKTDITETGSVQQGFESVSLDTLYKGRNPFIFNESFNVTTEIVPNKLGNKWSFNGWYVQTGNIPQNGDPQISKNTSLTQTINSEFLKTCGITDLHQNAEIKIYAKYSVGKFTVQTAKKGEGNVTVSIPKTVQA